MRSSPGIPRRTVLVLAGLLLVGCGRSNRESAPDAGAKSSNAKHDVKTLLDRATAALQNREATSALRLLTEAIQLDPNCAEAYFHRGSLLADAGQPTAALGDFHRAVELSPKDAKVRHTRGVFLMTQKQIDSAIDDFTVTLELHAKHGQALNNRGLAYLAKGDRERAVADFEAALKLDPKYVEALINRGFAAYQAGQHETALADYEQALELSPDNVAALNNRGLAHVELKDYEQAVADFTQAIARDRYNAKLYLERRECFLKLSRDDDARQDAAKVAWLGKLNALNRSVAQEPRAASNYVELAEHLIAGGESRVGLASYENAIQVRPDYGKSYSSRAAYWLSQRDFDRAIADCDRAIKVEPHFEAYSIRGDSYFQKGQFDRAISDYQKAKRLDSQVAMAFLQRAKQRAAAGQSAAAENDRERAFEIEPSLRDAE